MSTGIRRRGCSPTNIRPPISSTPYRAALDRRCHLTNPVEPKDLPSDADPVPAGPSHNREQPVVWERWQKKRTFVRALEGTYSELTSALLEQPRVLSFRDKPWKGGPQHFSKTGITPGTTAVGQSIETHIEAYGPGAYGQKHGHLNSAVFFVLKGRGHDVHDGRH